jgi:concanavalin A-like lectin/glucanase superfamily protein
VKKLALLVLIMGVVLVSSAVGQEFTDVTVGSADPGSTVVTEGVYEITGNGNDIWDNADAFQYYYTELTGDGMMVARVVDVGEGSNAWAKGGVMIRQSTDAGSMHAITALTGSEGGGAAFQRRVATDGSSDSNHGLADGPYAPPYWVKTVRIGNDFTGYLSADGETWVQAGDTVTIEMADPVLIGLAVTSHAAGELRTVTFDNIAVEHIVATAPEAWAMAAALDAPGYSDTDVVDGIYDIGEFSGDITYEFIVQSNLLEEQASMALIGRRNFGDTEVGLKYEQWNNTGTYGATVFGVADYDYGVATNPGMPTHLVFVSSEDTATTTLYVDGALQGSIDSAITLAGPVGIGNAAQAEDGSDFFDDFDGDIFGVAIYDAALSAGQIRTHADAYLMRGAADITAAGDAVVGDPNDGDWPGAETPDLAIDDDVNTKYLHFKGATEPTGFEVAPALGATVVTGLTLTTANDAPERDPVAFELYGSNESIEGPFVLIATGDVNDFAGEEAWPRFTMNATPIEFANNTAYAYYQIMFTAVRDAASANSMQIAEVELIGAPGPAVLFAEDFEGLPLGPNVDEGVAGDAVWTKTAPEGWLIDDSEMAGVGDPNTDGVTEWAGWSFADKAWWIEAAGNQDRSLFTFGSGTVAVGDPDEWDDADHTEGYFNSFLATPIIDLAGVAADAVQLRFASSWRPEFDDNYHQTANITVSFDGADPVEVLLWESDSASANYKPYATNEAVVVEIAVPEGAQNMVVTFGLYDAGNDWWWAIDNVDVVCN